MCELFRKQNITLELSDEFCMLLMESFLLKMLLYIFHLLRFYILQQKLEH